MKAKKIHFFSTHFSRKVCTVEFGVILSSLHRFVWKFPLLANRATTTSEKESRDNTAMWDDVTLRTNQLTSHMFKNRQTFTLDEGSVSSGLAISGNLRNSRRRMLVSAHCRQSQLTPAECFNLLQVFVQCFAEVFTDILRYQSMSIAQVVFYFIMVRQREQKLSRKTSDSKGV